MASASQETDKPCDKCGAPASWADEWTANLTYKDGIRYQTNIYLASPRMWPIGYIIASPYSPFHLERDIPNRNWRDAFEDLLALDSGGQMIDARVRGQEIEIAKKFYLKSIRRRVSSFNQALSLHHKQYEIVKRMGAMFKRTNNTEGVSMIYNSVIPNGKKIIAELLAEGEKAVAKAKFVDNTDWPASSYKTRGQWMSSLLSNGAIPDWQTFLFNSSDGDHISFARSEVADDGHSDGIFFTELELQKFFEDGRTMQYDTPAWSTVGGFYPTFTSPAGLEDHDVNSINDNESNAKSSPLFTPITPGALVPKAFLSQHMITERTTLHNGKMSVMARITNRRVNGQIEEKEFTDNPFAVIEEADKVKESMNEMYDTIMATGMAQEIALQEAVIKSGNEDELD